MTPVLLINAIHDPATGYSWAQSVARQLGRYGVLLTYEGWGHGSYNDEPVHAEHDRQLPDRRSTYRSAARSCPAVPPVS